MKGHSLRKERPGTHIHLWIRILAVAAAILALLIARPTPAFADNHTQDEYANAPYRFALRYNMDEIIKNPEKAEAFIKEYLQTESEFFKIARDPDNGLTYDGYNLEPETGKPADLRFWSAPSKECLDIAILVKALKKNPRASLVVSPDNPEKAPGIAADILDKKIRTYNEYYQQNPGYAGFLPWYYNRKSMIKPSKDWVGDIPGLDNGEWIWTLLVAENELRKAGFEKIADKYARYNDMIRSNVVKVFYDDKAGKVRADVNIENPLSKDTAYHTIREKPGRHTYLSEEHGVHEGQMLVLYVTLLGKNLPKNAADRIWKNISMKRIEHKFGTTWQAYWGSAHESWAYLFLPYRDIPEYKTLFRIREIIRSQNAAKRQYPGFATSTIGPGKGDVGYFSACGIEDINQEPIKHNDTFAIYGVFPMLLEFSTGKPETKPDNYALAWLLNSLKPSGMQGPLGGGESLSNDGTRISYAKTIDGTFPNIIALSGGLENETADMMKKHNIYDKFIARMKREYDKSFGKKPLNEPVSFALPTITVPVNTKLEYASEYLTPPQTGRVVISGQEYLNDFDYKALTSPFEQYYQKGISLDGTWEIISYRDSEEKLIKGHKPGHPTLKVPGHWINQGYFDVTGMTLRKTFKTPPAKPGERKILHFGGVIYLTTVRLNGKLLTTTNGETTHEGYFTPFEYDITNHIRENRENHLEVTILCPKEKPDTNPTSEQGGTGFPHWGANKRNILGVLGFHDTKPGNAIHQKHNVGGIWLPVRIFTANTTARFFNTPMVNTTLIPIEGKITNFNRRNAQINMSLPLENNTDKPVDVVLTVNARPANFQGQPADNQSWTKNVILQPGRQNVEFASLINDAKLWWPWHLGYPNLYRVTMTITTNDKTIAEHSLLTGIREISGHPRGTWYLNGRTLRILGDNVIPSMIPGTYTREDAQRDGKIIIGANVQLVRVHAHMPHPCFLEMTDQMGILTWQDFPQQWVSQWNDHYRKALLRQIREFARITVNYPSIVLINVHNENKYFETGNPHGLPRPSRGTWMNASRPAEVLDRIAKMEIINFWKKFLTENIETEPKVGIFVTEETGAEYHPYFGYYYGEGVNDFYFRPSPDAKNVFPEYHVFSKAWGWREDAFPEPGVGSIPSTSYERVAGGGGYNRFGPDEFGFQALDKYAVHSAVRDVIREENPKLQGTNLETEVNKTVKEIPWGYLYQTELPENTNSRTWKLYVKVVDKLAEHNLQAFHIPLWLKPEKPIEKITLDDLITASQEFQAWGTQITAEVYRRAGYGQTRFMLLSSEDDHGLFYSVDWAVLDSSRKPKKAYHALKRAYQPILASSENFSKRLIPGERWLNGLWINNDTLKKFENTTLLLTLKNNKGTTVKQTEINNLDLLPFAIRNFTNRIPEDFITIEQNTPPGNYQVSLTVRDKTGREISNNIYNLTVLESNLLADLEDPQKTKAREILEARYAQLHKHINDNLQLKIEQSDSWPDLVSRIRNTFHATWDKRKTDIEKNPEQLLQFPEFTIKLNNLIDARYKLEAAEQAYNDLVAKPTTDTETRNKYHSGYEREKERYAGILEETRKNFHLDAKDRKIIMGEIGARIPIPIIYGEEITTDPWFTNLVTELKNAGADKTAERIILYYNNRKGHWFARQILIYKALKNTLETKP